MIEQEYVLHDEGDRSAGIFPATFTVRVQILDEHADKDGLEGIEDLLASQFDCGCCTKEQWHARLQEDQKAAHAEFQRWLRDQLEREFGEERGGKFADKYLEMSKVGAKHLHNALCAILRAREIEEQEQKNH